MKTFTLNTRYRKRLADTVTPVSIYLRLRDQFANSLLLESSDYHGNTNTFSFICFDPIASFELKGGTIQLSFPDGSTESQAVSTSKDVPQALQQFSDRFKTDTLDFKFAYNGLFGYQAYDSVRHFEEVGVQTYSSEEREIPDLLYHLYRFVIVVNHFNNELYLFEHTYGEVPSQLTHIESLLNNHSLPQYGFQTIGSEASNLTDEEYLYMVRKGIEHCKLGDVFQIVLSRQFSQEFTGDEFNVYRTLRSVNPSPYLFYGDFGGFKLMGSSPEAQLLIQEGEATIHPIAGTFRRTGHDEEDTRLARELFDDPKENAEHVMLVDLARNDLSRNCSEVKVNVFKEIQYYSHVIHLVSTVTGQIDPDVSSIQLVADTFPAGTLSGAPKHRAMQLIDHYENQNRGFYGGSIGYLGFDGTFNQAIIIRSFLSKGNTLYFQAGAGIVFKSVPENELQEVTNKLMALRRALDLAAEIHPTQSQAIRPATTETNAL